MCVVCRAFCVTLTFKRGFDRAPASVTILSAMREGGGYVAANSRLVEVTLWMHRSDAAVKRIVCRRHVSTYTSYSRELLPVQQAGSYSRLLPRATPGATSRELLPTQRSSGSYFKIWLDFWVSWGGSGGAQGPVKALKNAGAVDPHIFEGFPGPPQTPPMRPRNPARS